MGAKRLVGVVAAFVIFWAIGSSSADDDHKGSEDDRRSVAEKRAPGAGKAATRSQRGKDRAARARPRSARPGSDGPSPQAPRAQRTYLVARIVDGDTLELGNGETVRLVGIDTPEVGECGYERAADALAAVALGRVVTLGASDEDRDAYGRLLRYVDVGSVDAGLRLIRQGLATARYDSRDGYGFHPREPRYVAADRAVSAAGCAQPRPQPLAGTSSCAPGYTPCIPSYPPDLDCADVDGPLTVTGRDPHGLDGEGDGFACE